MLILTRRIGQSIKIDDDISITYLGTSRINPNQIRLGIEAPLNHEIHRLEIYNQIQKNGRRRYREIELNLR